MTNGLISLPVGVALFVGEQYAVEFEHSGVVHEIVEVLLGRLGHQPQDILEGVLLVAEAVVRRNDQLWSAVTLGVFAAVKVEGLSVGLLEEIFGEGIAAEDLEASTQKLDAAVGLEILVGEVVVASRETRHGDVVSARHLLASH